MGLNDVRIKILTELHASKDPWLTRIPYLNKDLVQLIIEMISSLNTDLCVAEHGIVEIPSPSTPLTSISTFPA